MQYGWFETPRRLVEIETLCEWLNNNYVHADESSWVPKWNPCDFKKSLKYTGIWVLWRNILTFVVDAEDVDYYKGFLPRLDFTSLVFNKTTRRGWYYSSYSHPMCTEVTYGYYIHT